MLEAWDDVFIHPVFHSLQHWRKPTHKHQLQNLIINSFSRKNSFLFHLSHPKNQLLNPNYQFTRQQFLVSILKATVLFHKIFRKTPKRSLEISMVNSPLSHVKVHMKQILGIQKKAMNSYHYMNLQTKVLPER